jgi:acid phosphatase
VRNKLIVLTLAALIAACAATPHKSPAPLAAPTAMPAPVVGLVHDLAPDDNLNAVAWAQTAVEHDLVYREVYRSAQEKLLRALRDPRWDALSHDDRRGPFQGLKPAVILDIDETVLDNSPYQARLVRSGKAFNEDAWAQWCKEQAAKPLPGAVEFTQYAARRGVTVFYLSNRAKDLNEVTIANLRKAGFALNAGADSFLGLGVMFQDCKQIGASKGCRRKLVAERYRVLMQFGDQLGDFVDAQGGTPIAREQAVEPYLAWIGERWFVLPNPTYGAWETVLFGDDYAKSRGEQRQNKLDALRTD